MGERHICFIGLCWCFHLSVFFCRDIIIFSDAGNSQRHLLCRTAQRCCQGCQRLPAKIGGDVFTPQQSLCHSVISTPKHSDHLWHWQLLCGTCSCIPDINYCTAGWLKVIHPSHQSCKSFLPYSPLVHLGEWQLYGHMHKQLDSAKKREELLATFKKHMNIFSSPEMIENF